MASTSLHFLNAVPFSDGLIHGTVLAPDGRRMSNSLGTGVDPLEVIERYGADATRAWCTYFGTSGQDIRFSQEKIKDYRDFANKLWNATRLVLLKSEAAGRPDLSRLGPADRWILGRLNRVVEIVTRGFERFEFGPAIDALYEFAWHEFADYHLELMKAGLAEPGDAAQVVEVTYVTIGLVADGGAERARLDAELRSREQEIAALERKLANAAFTGKAPGQVVQKERERLTQAQQAAVRLRELLGQKPG